MEGYGQKWTTPASSSGDFGASIFVRIRIFSHEHECPARVYSTASGIGENLRQSILSLPVKNLKLTVLELYGRTQVNCIVESPGAITGTCRLKFEIYALAVASISTVERICVIKVRQLSVQLQWSTLRNKDSMSILSPDSKSFAVVPL